MNEPVLIDTGPLVAVLSASEAEHSACVRQFPQLRQPPITCWAVLTEAAWLLRRRTSDVRRLLEFWTSGVVRVEHLDEAAGTWIREFLNRFSDQNPQLADAALCCLANDKQMDTIFTLDRRDFGIYRTTDNRALEIIP